MRVFTKNIIITFSLSLPLTLTLTPSLPLPPSLPFLPPPPSLPSLPPPSPLPPSPLMVAQYRVRTSFRVRRTGGNKRDEVQSRILANAFGNDYRPGTYQLIPPFLALQYDYDFSKEQVVISR